jgi:hypothetical protein
MDRGFDVRVKSGQGYLPGARVIAVGDGETIDVAVKASQERVVGFTRLSRTRWRTLSVVDLVVVVVPGEESKDKAEVFAFKKKPLERIFNRAWKALEEAKRPIGFNMPVFVPIDRVSRKNVGHDICDLKRRAIWSVPLSSEELEQRSGAPEESYVDQFRRRFAAENGVNISQVMISIVGKAK